MSLKEAYSLAHTAQCRLQIAASRPDRNLRFVVGHLMHYEHLRLRIVEIEHDISKSERAQAVAFKGTGHVNDRSLRHKPSTGQLGRRSPPPPVCVTEDEVEDDDFDAGIEDDDEDAGLGLTRFPSGAARPPQPPPELEPDDGEDEDEDEPISPEEPDQETLEAAIRGQESADLAKMYEGVRRCPCHGKTDSPSISRMWELPASEQKGKNPGVTFAVAEVTAVA